MDIHEIDKKYDSAFQRDKLDKRVYANSLEKLVAEGFQHDGTLWRDGNLPLRGLLDDDYLNHFQESIGRIPKPNEIELYREWVDYILGYYSVANQVCTHSFDEIMKLLKNTSIIEASKNIEVINKPLPYSPNGIADRVSFYFNNNLYEFFCQNEHDLEPDEKKYNEDIFSVINEANNDKELLVAIKKLNKKYKRFWSDNKYSDDKVDSFRHRQSDILLGQGEFKFFFNEEEVYSNSYFNYIKFIGWEDYDDGQYKNKWSDIKRWHDSMVVYLLYGYIPGTDEEKYYNQLKDKACFLKDNIPPSKWSVNIEQVLDELTSTQKELKKSNESKPLETEPTDEQVIKKILKYFNPFQ